MNPALILVLEEMLANHNALRKICEDTLQCDGTPEAKLAILQEINNNENFSKTILGRVWALNQPTAT